jgi:holo-[acyl-carrier protein] synthase
MKDERSLRSHEGRSRRVLCSSFMLRPSSFISPKVIYGIGTDICDIRRIAQTLARRGERFAEKVLGTHELAVFRARRAKVEARGVAYLATRFAAKEAFSKAIGLGMRMPMTWRACEVVKAPSGAPQIQLHGELALWFAARRLRAHVSVSDEAHTATAFVVVEQHEETMKP